MEKQNTRAALAAMLSGKVTKETELLRAKMNGDVDPRLAEKILSESNLPSASELNFKQVAGANGILQMVEGNSPQVQGYGKVDPDSIKALLGGKKGSLIKEELRNTQQNVSNTPVQSAPVFDINEEIKRRSQSGYIAPKLTESMFPKNESPSVISTINPSDLLDLVENCVYGILGSIVGEPNDGLKSKDLIKGKIEEAVTFLKLTKALKK